MLTTVREMDMESLADPKKMEFYGTVNGDGTPHVTLLNSVYRLHEDTLVWGEFCNGCSKQNQRARPRVAILAADAQMRLTACRARWDHCETSGEMMDRFNQIPRYRYNTIFGFSPIHFLKLERAEELGPAQDGLDERLKAEQLAARIYPGSAPDALSVLSRRFFEADSSFRVIGWVDGGGEIQLAPLPQAALTRANRVVFTMAPYGELLARIPEGATAAVFSVMCEKMLSVLVKGPLKRFTMDGLDAAYIEIESVYSPITPKNTYIYPRAPLLPVREFRDALYEFNV